VTKTIPITTSFNGELPDGYWADMEALSTTSASTSRGLRPIFERYARRVLVDLTDKTSTIYSTFDVTFYDKNNTRRLLGDLIGTLPTSTVRLPIYPMKACPWMWKAPLSARTTLRRTTRSQGRRDAVHDPPCRRPGGAGQDRFRPARTDRHQRAGRHDDRQRRAPRTGRRALLDSTTVSILLEIREMVISQTFEQLEIQVHGIQSKANVTLDIPAADLTGKAATAL
jgi:hypothetical protein